MRLGAKLGVFQVDREEHSVSIWETPDDGLYNESTGKLVDVTSDMMTSRIENQRTNDHAPKPLSTGFNERPCPSGDSDRRDCANVDEDGGKGRRSASSMSLSAL